MSKLITLSVTLRNEGNVSDYVSPLMMDMQEFSKRADVEAVSLSCHFIDEDGKLGDTIFAATPDPVRL